MLYFIIKTRGIYCSPVDYPIFLFCVSPDALLHIVRHFEVIWSTLPTEIVLFFENMMTSNSESIIPAAFEQNIFHC